MVVAANAAARTSGTPAPLAPEAPPADAASPTAPFDELAEPTNDAVSTLADRVSQRAAIVLLRQQSIQTELQLKLDRMRADFNAAQEERSEQMREMNALRDMAVEQGKKDDEILKKFIAMI